jgi:hypothetical protein
MVVVVDIVTIIVVSLKAREIVTKREKMISKG